jgi:hypothetical protein
MIVLKSFIHILIFLGLTLLTQVGGVIYLLCFPLYFYLKKRTNNAISRFFFQFSAFSLVYCLATFTLIPLIAKGFGRVPMPLTYTDLKPQNWGTALCNRHYVRPDLRKLTIEVSEQMKQKHGVTLLYLEAQHPFFNGWPLLPHLSHSDGKKLDVALLWKDRKTDKYIAETPSSIGYGVFVNPKPNEQKRTQECEAQGFWQYGYMEKVVSQARKPDFELEEAKTAAMVRLFCEQPKVKKVLIEPYLKTRLGLAGLKNLRHQGCNAVRHDDHIHVELE